MDLDATPSAASTPSPERQQLEGTPTSVTLDDPDVRLAAEALGDLRAGEFILSFAFAFALRCAAKKKIKENTAKIPSKIKNKNKANYTKKRN